METSEALDGHLRHELTLASPLNRNTSISHPLSSSEWITNQYYTVEFNMIYDFSFMSPVTCQGGQRSGGVMPVYTRSPMINLHLSTLNIIPLITLCKTSR